MDHHSWQRYLQPYLRFIRYGVSGALGGVVQIGSLYVWVSRLGMQDQYLWGVVIGFCLSVSVSFILQKYWTFADRKQQHLTHRQFMIYGSIALGGLVLNTGTLYVSKHIIEALGINFFHFWYLVAQVATIAFVSVLSFLVNYFITFRGDTSQPL